MFVFTLLAMNRATFSGISTRSASAFLRRMAILVSRSGGWMSASGDLPWRTVAGDDDLLLPVVEGVEDVEELLLRPVLSGDELDVVDEQHVGAAVLLPERRQPLEADGVDHLVDEAVGGDVGELQVPVAGLDVVPDRVHEMGLAEADPAVEEEGVVGLRGDLGDRAGGRVGELVRRAHHEAVEGVLGIERGGRSRIVFGRLRDGLGGLALEGDADLAPIQLRQGLRDHALVVLREPVLELGVRHVDAEQGALEDQVVGGLEPGGEAVTVHLGFDPCEDLVPEVRLTERRTIRPSHGGHPYMQVVVQ
jgi:hypothetical protein